MSEEGEFFTAVTPLITIAYFFIGLWILCAVIIGWAFVESVATPIFGGLIFISWCLWWYAQNKEEDK